MINWIKTFWNQLEHEQQRPLLNRTLYSIHISLRGYWELTKNTTRFLISIAFFFTLGLISVTQIKQCIRKRYEKVWVDPRACRPAVPSDGRHLNCRPVITASHWFIMPPKRISAFVGSTLIERLSSGFRSHRLFVSFILKLNNKTTDCHKQTRNNFCGSHLKVNNILDIGKTGAIKSASFATFKIVASKR